MQGRITKDIKEILQECFDKSELPENLEKYLHTPIPSIRSCVKSPDGSCMVESDYATAEIRALAFISGDVNLIRLMTESDKQFGLVMVEDEATPVRLSYDENCGIPEHNRREDFIMHLAKSNKIIRKVEESELLRDSEGNLRHPSHDLHWSLVEFMYEVPRESLDKKMHRDGMGKVGNFSTSYGATPSTLERKIYADSGVLPEPGTGDRIFKALETRQGRAVEYLEEQQMLPSMYPFITAASGRRRHFVGTNDKSLGFKERKTLMSSQGREARNFPMQESVGATAMRACIWLIEAYKALGMKARVMICLYDALVTVCPIEERHLVAQLHQLYMAENNEWEYNERKMYYPIDTEFVFRWTDKRRSEHEQKLLGII